jgi:channel protein (hemolysin III family)
MWLSMVWFFCLTALALVYFPVKTKMWLNALAWNVAGYSTAPFIIQLKYFANESMIADFKVWPWLTGGLIYTVGAIVYASRVPEKFYEKTFDIFGSSHQIFHFCIVGASILHIWAGFQVFN